MTPTILIVDDNRAVLDAIASYLRSRGFKVLAEVDPIRALDILLDRDDIKALVCDFRMPVMNGARLARAAKDHNPDMVVVMLSLLSAPEIASAPWDKWIRKDSTTAASLIQELRSYDFFPKDVVEEFGGDEELLSTLESLAKKLRE